MNEPQPTSLLAGTTHLVAGFATRGSIGYGIAKKIGEEGGHVLATCLPGEQPERIARGFAKRIGIAETDVFPLDVTKEATVEALIKELRTRGVVLDGFVHAMAWSDPHQMRGDIRHVARENHDKTMWVSAGSLLQLGGLLLPFFNPKGASIITLSFAASQAVFREYGLMSSAKAALESNARLLAVEIGEWGHRVNVLSPSPEPTPSATAVPHYEGIGAFEELTSILGGRAELDEIADVAVCFLSPRFRAITGQNLQIDRGSSAVRLPLVRNFDKRTPRNKDATLLDFHISKMREPITLIDSK